MILKIRFKNKVPFKLSSGNVVLSIEKIDLIELVNQTNGEFSEKFDTKSLSIVSSLPDKSVFIEADGRRLWRILENLYNNVAKYAFILSSLILFSTAIDKPSQIRLIAFTSLLSIPLKSLIFILEYGKFYSEHVIYY